MLLKNKRASFAITLLVFLVLFIVLVALFKFIINTNARIATVNSAESMNGIYAKEELGIFYLQQAGDSAFKSIYARDKSPEEIKIKFKQAFEQEFLKYEFDDENLKELQNIVNEGKFIVEFNNGDYFIEINEWEIKDKIQGIQFDYFPKISLKFNVTEINTN